jgi:peptidoglycan/xylan/chitin deacetylase (PgdA/CDA1 family)
MTASDNAAHENAGEGKLHEDFSQLSTDEQRMALELSEAAHERVFGRKPLGFRAPDRLMSRDTRALLAERGYRYDASYCDDDQPYTVDFDGQRLAELPIHEPWIDKLYYQKYRIARVVTESFLDEFDATYAIGGLFSFAIHPRGDYGSGRGARIRALEPVLRSFQEHPRLWLATCGELADWVLR